MKKDLNKGLLILVIVLSLLVVGLSSYLIYDKVVEKDDDKIVNDDIVEKDNNNIIEDDEINKEVVDVSKFYEKYANEYSYSISKIVELPTEICEDTAKLKLNSDGTYEFDIRICRGSGSSGKGTYIVNNNGYKSGKIFLINDLCKLDVNPFSNLVGYGNCSPIYELTYIEENEEIILTIDSHGLGNAKLKKQ